MTNESDDLAADSLQIRISEQILEYVGDSLSFSRTERDALGKRAVDRAKSIFSGGPSVDWETIARRDGDVIVRSAEELPADQASHYGKWREVWHMAPLSIRRVEVRRLGAGTNRMVMPDGVRISSVLRNPLGARFADPPVDAILFEVVIPTLVRPMLGKDFDVPAYLGLTYAWNPRTRRWIGAYAQTAVYIPFGHPDIVPPP